MAYRVDVHMYVIVRHRMWYHMIGIYHSIEAISIPLVTALVSPFDAHPHHN